MTKRTRKRPSPPPAPPDDRDRRIAELERRLKQLQAASQKMELETQFLENCLRRIEELRRGRGGPVQPSKPEGQDS